MILKSSKQERGKKESPLRPHYVFIICKQWQHDNAKCQPVSTWVCFSLKRLTSKWSFVCLCLVVLRPGWSEKATLSKMNWKDRTRMQSKESRVDVFLFSFLLDESTVVLKIILPHLRPPVQASRTSANHSSAPLKQPVKKSGGCLWRGLRLLLILALLAAVFYYVYCHLLQREDNALDIQWSNT